MSGPALLLVAALGAASAAVPMGVRGAILGPDGAVPLRLLDLDDLTLELAPEAGAVRLRDRRTGRDVVDGEWPAGVITTVGPTGAERWVRADSEGRVTHITWPSGRRCVVERDDRGRASAVLGPGPSRRRIVYDGGVVVEDTLGTAWSITSEDERVWSIRDGAGRQVRVRLDAETGRIVSWEDPRGLASAVVQRPDVTEVVGPGGAVWRVGREAGGGFVEQPDGLRWTWLRDTAGNLARVTDPSGVQAEWSYDRSGRVVSAELAGRRQVVDRDDQGRPVALTDASGATVQVRWEGDRVARVTDASGAAVVFERDANGSVEAILGRTGGRWELDHDLDGRLEGVTDPAGRTLALDYDGAGDLSLVEMNAARVRIDRDSAGRVVGVVDPRGLRTGLVRDPTGRVREVRAPASTLHIERDAAGEVVGVRSGQAEVYVRRDAAGRPIAAGPVQWTRDLMGVIDRLTAPGISLTFGHDTTGRLTSVRADEQTLTITRNTHGEPMRWDGVGAPVRVERDAVGRVTREDVGGRSLTGVRGVRGLLDRVEGDRGTWRWARGSDAGVLRVDGPDGAGVGTDRDPAGRITLVRLPGGGLLRRGFEDGIVYEQIKDGAGQVVSEDRWSYDLEGQVARTRSEDGATRVWKTGPDGAVVSIEVEDEPEASWFFGPGVERGPGGWVRALDLLGRTTELMVGDTWPVWGAVGGAWAYERGPSGALEVVSGADGAFYLVHDAFARLVQVRTAEARWDVVWDARGRPFRVVRPSGVQDFWWAPGQTRGVPLATGDRGAVAWMDSGAGALAWSRGGGVDPQTSAGAVVLPGGLGIRVEDALGLLSVRWGQRTGVADSAVLDPLGTRGGLLVFAGGPELFTGGALDPSGSERTDGTLDWPWIPSHGRARVVRSAWDPAGWAARVPWGDPLALAREMGLVELPDPGPAEPARVALQWLPEAVDHRPQRIGPPRGVVSLADELDPLVWRVVEHLRHAEGPLTGAVVAGPVIGDDTLGDLPPGVAISGLQEVDRGWTDVSRPELSKKVVAAWGSLL